MWPAVGWSIRRVASTGSTNADVAAEARAGAAEGFAVVADHQSAGRGRLDRRWEAPAGAALAVSFLLRPTEVPAARWPWLPLLTGVACVEAVERVTGVTTVLKWPNDVLIGGLKLAGILVERVDTPAGAAAVVGVGLNVSQSATELPPNAVSLTTAGVVDPSRDAVLDELGARLAAWYQRWRAAAGRPKDGLAAAYVRRCATLGQLVRLELPGGEHRHGRAVDVDESGRLVLDTADGLTAVSAGDVVHLRPGRAQPGRDFHG